MGLGCHRENTACWVGPQAGAGLGVRKWQGTFPNRDAGLRLEEGGAGERPWSGRPLWPVQRGGAGRRRGVASTQDHRKLQILVRSWKVPAIPV